MHRLGLLGVVELGLLALERVQPGAEDDRLASADARLLRQLGVDRPVLDRHERLDLPLALDDDAQRRRLHAPGRESALDLLPEEAG